MKYHMKYHVWFPGTPYLIRKQLGMVSPEFGVKCWQIISTTITHRKRGNVENVCNSYKLLPFIPHDHIINEELL